MTDIIKLFCIGDVISKLGSTFLREQLPKFKKDNNIDVVVANGENASVGNGLLPASADFLLDSGVDVVTTGNHIYKRREIYSYLDDHPQILRPANYPATCVGKGYYVYDGGAYSLLFVNILGVSYMEPLENPFFCIDRILKENPSTCVIVDFHAEATGEKCALGYYLDGRASLVFGTHTHVQTADAQILPNGTGYITDLGMTGAVHSVLGVSPECIIERFTTQMPTQFQNPQSGECHMDGIVAEINIKTGKCIKIEAVSIKA